MTNPFEQIAKTAVEEEFELPDLPPYKELSRFKEELQLPRNRIVFRQDHQDRTLWVDDEFFSVKNNVDPIYLSADKTKLDLITLLHRVTPGKSPYEDREMIKYKQAGGLVHPDDTDYLVHPLTAFFFIRWLLSKEVFITHGNVSQHLSPHARKLVEMALEQYCESDPVGYAYAMAGVSVTCDERSIQVATPTASRRFLTTCQEVLGPLSPAQAVTVLRSSFRPCDGSGRAMARAGKHPPFYKPYFVLPLWQRVYAEFGGRVTSVLLQEAELSRGCNGCLVRDNCSFIFAKG